MSPELEEWKAQMERLPEDRAAFEQWLFVHIAGVLFADKAGELLTLTDGHHGLGVDRQLGFVEARAPVWNYSHQVLCRSGSRVRVVIFDGLNVRKALSEAPCWALAELGYRPGLGPADFLEEVARRWRETGRVPHEIGLALGYPVKDVLGYIGLVASPCTGMCGWRIHGDRGASLCRSRKYKQARQQAEAFLSRAAG